MDIRATTGGLAATNGYLLLDPPSKSAAVIDAPEGTASGLIEAAQAQGCAITHLLFTHGHWDHISDHKVVTDAFPDCKVMIHRLEEPRLERPSAMGFDLPYVIPPRKADAYLEDGGKVSVGGIEVEVLHTPGHAAGHVCLYAAKEKVVFTGDLVMAGLVGRYDFADGDLELLKASLRRILALPDDVAILSGHGEATTVGQERKSNPFVWQWGLGKKR